MRSSLTDWKGIVCWLVLLAGCVSAIALTILLQINSGTASRYQRVDDAVARLKNVEHFVLHDALRIMSGQIANYDRISAASHESKLLLRHLSDGVRFTDAHAATSAASQLNEYRLLLTQRAELVEAFKSNAAVLNNAQRYFPVLSGEVLEALEGKRNAAGLARAIDSYSSKLMRVYMTRNTVDLAAYNRQAEILEGLNTGRTDTVTAAVKTLIMHGHALARAATEMQSALDKLRALNPDRLLEQIAGTASAGFEATLEQGRNLRSALIAVFVVMFFFVIYFLIYLTRIQGTLSSAFQDVSAANTEIEALNGSLEARIDERTAELRAMHAKLKANLVQLSDAQDEIIRSGKMAQLGQLTATVAHEIRNPLGAVRTSAFLIERKFKSEVPGLEKPLKRISDGVMRCDGIITELLDFARSSALNLEARDLDEWLENLVREQSEQLPGQVALECRFGLGRSEIAFDKDHLSRAIINFLNNACEAMVGKGKEVPENPTQNPKIVISTAATARGIEIAVTDNGPGISEENMKKIMEPLFTTKGFGVGLGLPAVEKIFEQHGGGMEIESTPGDGATFRGWLPSEPRKMAA